jgi:tRNA threonylcarbamoyladenosine biosynthesis protein TsaE
VVLVEWPERLGHLRPAETLVLTLAQGGGEDERIATLDGWPDRIMGII